MFKALYRTVTEICDSKKAAYSFLNMIGACVLHLCFAVGVKDALFLVSPLTFLTFTQAFVDACAARQQKPATALPFPALLPPPAPPAPAVPSVSVGA
jgi:hypothetical protein